MARFFVQYKLKGKLLTLRNAEPEDAAELIALINRLDSETDFLSREAGEFEMTEERERAFIQQRVDMPYFRFAVAVLDGRIVGVSDAYFRTRRRYRHSGEVSIAILQKYWGMGIGRTVLEDGIQWLRQNGVENVELTVDTQNLRALGLYTHLGFQVEGTLLRHHRMADGSYRNAYRMLLDLRP